MSWLLNLHCEIELVDQGTHLICEAHKDGQEEHKHLPVVCLLNLSRCEGHELVSHVGQERDSDSKIVPICLHEIMASDGGWVDVVLTEWTNESLHKQTWYEY